MVDVPCETPDAIFTSVPGKVAGLTVEECQPTVARYRRTAAVRTDHETHYWPIYSYDRQGGDDDA